MIIQWGSIWPGDCIDHAWKRGENGRWSSVCSAAREERWSRPYARTGRRTRPQCKTCRSLLDDIPAAEEAARRVLGSVWPRSLSITELRAKDPALSGFHRARAAVDILIEHRLVYRSETGTGRYRYVAGRKLVEAIGRTYGMVR